jgi:Ca2+-binding EF-hand superfamily protein
MLVALLVNAICTWTAHTPGHVLPPGYTPSAHAHLFVGRAAFVTMDDGSYPATSPPPERQPSAVYQLLDDEQIASIHVVADTLFDVLDRNGDNAISEEELAAHLLLARYEEAAVEELFGMMDVNPKDGAISRAELREAFVRYPPLRSAPAMGSLSKSERAAVHEEADATFATIDTDRSGTLSLAELQAHFACTEGPAYSASARARRRSLPSTRSLALALYLALGLPWSLSLTQAVANIFDTLDANQNGEISPSEFRGAYVRYRAMRLLLGSRTRKR